MRDKLLNFSRENDEDGETEMNTAKNSPEAIKSIIF